MPETMARIAPSQPNEPMARIASRRKSTILLYPNLLAFNFRAGLNLRVDKGFGEKRV